MDDAENKLRSHITQSLIVLVTIMAIVATLFCTSAFGAATPPQEVTPAVTAPSVHAAASDNVKWGLVSASIAFGLGAIGAGIAISHVGAAAMGAVAEKPQIAGQALIFVALAEGLVVFGFITALMILGKV